MLRACRILRGRTITVQILSKPDCCLCDQALFAINRLVTNFGERGSVVKVEKVDIQSNADLLDEYSLTIPVILVNGDVVAESKIDIPKIRECIERKLES
jgi:hypothetical protein